MSKNDIQLGRKSAYTANPEDLTIIGYDTEHRAGEHPLWDERATAAVDEDLVLNIMVYGVIEPINVVRDGEQLLLVDGRGRTKAAREANKRLAKQGSSIVKIPLLMRGGADHNLLGVMVSANEHRRADDMMVKAAKAQRMLDFGGDIAEVANAFGVTTTTIEEWQRLLSASPKVKQAVRKGQLSPTAAAILAKLSRDKQEEKLPELVAKGKASVTATEKLVRDEKAKAKGKKPTAQAPTKAKLKRMLSNPKTSQHLHPEAEAMLAWVLGEGKVGEVKGLAALLKELKL